MLVCTWRSPLTEPQELKAVERARCRAQVITVIAQMLEHHHPLVIGKLQYAYAGPELLPPPRPKPTRLLRVSVPMQVRARAPVRSSQWR